MSHVKECQNAYDRKESRTENAIYAPARLHATDLLLVLVRLQSWGA
jgi:hypothetical protein